MARREISEFRRCLTYGGRCDPSMEGAVTLRTIDEDSDCREVISNRPLVVGADCPDRNQELMAARDTFPKVTDRVGIELGAAAVRQYGWPSLPATGSP